MYKISEFNKRIVDEITDTIIDNLYEESEHYMYEFGEYEESNDKFVEDQEKYVLEVIKELNKRITK
tara:strand:+ start:381 stop:578 length:198 start_codon:yes stop_codon:yes gene_type:complete